MFWFRVSVCVCCCVCSADGKWDGPKETNWGRVYSGLMHMRTSLPQRGYQWWATEVKEVKWKRTTELASFSAFLSSWPTIYYIRNSYTYTYAYMCRHTVDFQRTYMNVTHLNSLPSHSARVCVISFSLPLAICIIITRSCAQAVWAKWSLPHNFLFKQISSWFFFVFVH